MAGEATTVVAPRMINFRLDVAEADGVRLELDFDPGCDPEFVRGEAGWQLDLPRPEVDRLEYQFTVRFPGHTDWITDPGNPRRVPNPFGDKSEAVFPDYRPPGWLVVEPAGTITDLTGEAGTLATAIPATLWSPEGLPDSVRVPLLVAHDGSDMANRGSLLRWATHRSTVAPIRLLLLDPPNGLRDEWYAANADYSDEVALVLARARESVAVGPVIGLGASLGAVGMMTLHRSHPGELSGLALQSGSFFTAELDPQESGYRLFEILCRATAAISTDPVPGVPTLITVGAVEENRWNNESLAAVLRDQGWTVQMRIVRDAHTMTGWRDAWYPALDELLDRVDPRS